ncbi:MAG: imidazole glycerol phosphate synthase cyclase subunit [Pseudomonadota bacterium]|nr:imidazole glycerol phosphate synthase cyclase subunit [Pseudomonadota bacterium]
MISVKKRIISRFDIKGPNLVKGVNLEGLRVIGKPEFFADLYYKDNIDEIIFQDCVASLYGRNNLKNIISKVSKNIFVPLTVGGGLRNLKDVKNVLHAGADRVSINSEGIKNPKFIDELVKEFGSSTIACQIQVQKKLDRNYLCFYENGRQETDLDPLEWAMKLQDMNVGEIILTFINFDGTGKGFDNKLIKELRNKLDIPLVVSGGIGNKLQVLETFKNNVDGVAVSSAFHYFYLKQNLDIIRSEKYSEGNLDYINNIDINELKNNFSIIELKNFLKQNSINCR